VLGDAADFKRPFAALRSNGSGTSMPAPGCSPYPSVVLLLLRPPTSIITDLP